MITIYLVNNAPWVLWTDMSGDMLVVGRRFGEWAWVGREA